MEEVLIEKLVPVLRQSGLISGNEADSGLDITVLAADGSSRQFVRIYRYGRSLCLAVLPATHDPRDLAESEAAWHIGCHLHRKGVPVPELYGRHRQSGILLFEDLGDLRLYELVASTDFNDIQSLQKLTAVYEKILLQLIAMQLDGAEGFDDSWCWDTPQYDRNLMLVRESGYFLRAFWQDMLGRPIPEGIEQDFEMIADRACRASASFFLHRDFQSRNIMIEKSSIRIIDFQAGRRGPLAYDLASLLIDPYAALPEQMQEQLFEFYIGQLSRRLALDLEEFKEQYQLLAVQRNLQIIGAFAFLSQVRRKDFFAKYIRPAVVMLDAHLHYPLFDRQTVLRRTVGTALEVLA